MTQSPPAPPIDVRPAEAPVRFQGPAVDTSTTYRVVDSPVGPLTLTGHGATLTRCWFDGPGTGADPTQGLERDDAAFAEAVDQLAAYFERRLHTFDLDLQPAGTEFQRRVWSALCRIPYGETWSYGRLADEVGSPGGARAVGLANGRNPIGIIVPCHRVIGADGTLTGYAGGLERKQLLLDLERGAERLW